MLLPIIIIITDSTQSVRKWRRCGPKLFILQTHSNANNVKRLTGEPFSLKCRMKINHPVVMPHTTFDFELLKVRSLAHVWSSASIWGQLLNLKQRLHFNTNLSKEPKNYQKLLFQIIVSSGPPKKTNFKDEYHFESSRFRSFAFLSGFQFESKRSVQNRGHLPWHRLHHAGWMPATQVRPEPEGVQKRDARSRERIQRLSWVSQFLFDVPKYFSWTEVLSK